ncbi:hypothetical protein GH722_08875 [Alphaproteobacteria bacterium HT1-32]|nr:hypothetical protein [Alphaproteobacteria bacterium HT1-32]
MPSIKTRSKYTLTAVAVAVAASLTATSFTPAAADFPDKPITVIVGTGAGGGADRFARTIAKHAPKHLGVDMVVVNKPGGGGQVALNDFIANGETDGYTLFTALIPHIIYWSQTRPDGQSGFQLDDLVHIAQPVRIPSGFMVPASSEFKTFDDLVKFAKANPGKLTMGMNGKRSGGHGLVKMLEKAAGIDIAEIAYGGGSKQVKGVLSNEVAVLNTNVMHAVQYKDELRPLAFAGEKRSALAPDTPTLRELGYDVVDYVTRGFVAPKGIDMARVEILRKGLKAMSEDPGFIADLKALGLPADYMNHEETQVYIDNFLKNNDWLLKEFKQ